MPDKTVVVRMKRQRAVRTAVGWQAVKVWVPTEADAEAVRQLARDCREKAEALHGLPEEVPAVTPEIATRIADAIVKHGSAAYNTPSGAVLHLMSRLAAEGDLTSFSRAVVILARANPAISASAAFVEKRVPAKVAEYLIRHCSIEASAFAKWAEANPEWTDDLKKAVWDTPRFPHVVAAMAGEIKRWHLAH